MPQKNNYKKIDVHNHIYPKSYIKELSKRNSIPKIDKIKGENKFYIFPKNISRSGRKLENNFYDINTKIEIMDQFNIDKAVISLGNPWVDCFESEKSVEIAEKMNNEIHKLVTKYPDRLVGLGVIPLKDIEAAKRELDRIKKDLNINGAVIGSNIDGMYLDNLTLDPFYVKANELNFNLYIHPRNPYGLQHLGGYQHTLPISLGFPFDTTLSLTKLILSGKLDKYENINFIGSHAGGAIPYLMKRVDQATDSDELGLKKKPSEYVKEDIIFDTIIYGTEHLNFLENITSANRILFATDKPFPITNVQEMFEQVKNMNLREEKLEKIFHENAERLFKI